jgi:hypothetical protein
VGTGQQFSHTLKKMFDDGATGGLLKSLPREGGWTLRVMVQHFAKQRLLVPEGGVKAWAIDAHGLGQIGERSSLVTLAPKHLQGALQGRGSVELTWSTMPCGSFVTLHAFQYKPPWAFCTEQ